jgi:hypothetical protein
MEKKTAILHLEIEGVDGYEFAKTFFKILNIENWGHYMNHAGKNQTHLRYFRKEKRCRWAMKKTLLFCCFDHIEDFSLKLLDIRGNRWIPFDVVDISCTE